MSINPNLKLFKLINNRKNNNNSTDTMNSQQQQKSQQQLQQQHQHQQKNKYNSFDATSSILSDYDDLEVIDDDQSLYVLFNPKSLALSSRGKQKSQHHDSDILSFTNTSNTNDEYQSDTEKEEEDSEIEEEEEEEDEAQEDDRVSLDNENNDTEVLNRDRLSHKINSWYTANVVSSSHHQLLIDERIASWELDEEANILESSQESLKLLEESKSILREFYGDDLFKYLNQDEIAKVKKFHKMVDIKNYLLDKTNKNNNSLLDQLLYKVLLFKEKKHNDTTFHRQYNIGTTDYINYLTKDVPSYSPAFVAPSTISDTTTGGSSLIMCGGVGFGGSASWNDI